MQKIKRQVQTADCKTNSTFWGTDCQICKETRDDERRKEKRSDCRMDADADAGKLTCRIGGDGGKGSSMYLF